IEGVLLQNKDCFGGEDVLKLSQSIPHIFGNAIRNGLIQERLLPFEKELLILNRAYRQPGQDQTRQNHREQKSPCDLSHLDPSQSMLQSLPAGLRMRHRLFLVVGSVTEVGLQGHGENSEGAKVRRLLRRPPARVLRPGSVVSPKQVYSDLLSPALSSRGG